MACKILPFLSGKLRGIIQELSQQNNPIASEIIKIDDLVNQAISIQEFIPEKFVIAIKEKMINDVLTGEVSMLTIRMDGSFLISFLPKDKDPEYTEDGTWARRNRQEGRIGKVFQSAIVKPFKQSEWEDFVNLFKAEICQCDTFQLVSGEDIRKWYDGKNYHSFKGTLGNSCMRYDEAQKFFDIYVENAKMLITTKGGKLTGRAIVWEIDENTTILDRIYTCFDYLEQCFIDYAKEHKWIIRSNNSLLHTGEEQYWLTPEDNYNNSKRLNFSIKLKSEYDYYPYVDSFRYLSSDRLTLTTWNNTYALDSTDGSFEEIEPCMCCDHCGREFYGFHPDEDDLPDDLHWSEWDECYLCDDCCWWSEYMDDYIPNRVSRTNVYYDIHRYESVPTECINDFLIDNPDDARTDSIVEINGDYYDVYMPGVFYNEETKKYEIRPNSN